MRQNGARPDELNIYAFAVPPRFANATFESYRPDPDYPSQQAAVERLRAAIGELNEAIRPRGLLGRLRGVPIVSWQGLYLDGRFGVGKTHLLAAAWHAFDGPKAYLSFQELTYAVGALGMARTLELFGVARLVCLDEFELDDPGNTMLATSFVRGTVERDVRLIVTSNTLPGELGAGRFSADDFKREIGALAAAFEPVRLDGEDYRQRRYGKIDSLPRVVPDAMVGEHADTVRWPELLRLLAASHPLYYPEIIARFEVLGIVGLESIPDQDSALRFVHFIDKLYDRATPLVISTRCTLPEIFPPSYGYGGFERKFRRCQSRLYELLAQPLVAGRGVDFPTELAEEDAHARRP